MAASPLAVRDVWGSRELLRNLVSKELKVRYKSSVLGFAWSLVTPLLMTAVFTVVFATFLRIPFGDGTFAPWFLAGYLVWQFFANSVTTSTPAIVANGALIRKVWFPREVIPLSMVLAQGVHLLLALLATTPVFIVTRGFHPELLVGVAGALLLLTAFSAGVALLFAAANVKFRDLQELSNVLFLAWFYATPIIYTVFVVADNAPWALPVVQANPMTHFVELFQTLLYGIPTLTGPHPGPTWPTLTEWGICLVWAAGSLVVGTALFRRLSVTFAKEV